MNVKDRLKESVSEAVKHSVGKKKLRVRNRKLVDIFPADQIEITADWLKKFRLEALVVDQETFAELLGVSKSSIKNWEQGKGLEKIKGTVRRLLVFASQNADEFIKLSRQKNVS